MLNLRRIDHEMTDGARLFADLRNECIQGYEWPDALRLNLKQYPTNLIFDGDLLLRLTSGSGRSGPLVITFLSREYLPLGIAWAKCARRVGINRYVIAVADRETACALESLKIPHIRIDVRTYLES